MLFYRKLPNLNTSFSQIEDHFFPQIARRTIEQDVCTIPTALIPLLNTYATYVVSWYLQKKYMWL